jgi:hypothetical protein
LLPLLHDRGHVWLGPRSSEVQTAGVALVSEWYCTVVVSFPGAVGMDHGA